MEILKKNLFRIIELSHLPFQLYPKSPTYIVVHQLQLASGSCLQLLDHTFLQKFPEKRFCFNDNLKVKQKCLNKFLLGQIVLSELIFRRLHFQELQFCIHAFFMLFPVTWTLQLPQLKWFFFVGFKISEK